MEVFLLNTFKTTFSIANLTQRWTQSEPFFENQDTFVDFKKAGEVSPLPSSCALVNVTEYTSVSLNMPKYPWKCLNKLFSLCQCSKYAWTSYMFERLLKMPRVPNKPRFWICHGCLRKGYADFPICLIMALYASIMPENAAICLNVPQYTWKWLNIAKYRWICLKMPELTALTILGLSICRDMVIKTLLL